MGRRCKHMATVEHALLISSEAALGKNVVIEGQDLGCLGCREQEHARDGRCRGKREDIQRYERHVCERRFQGNLGFECRQVTRLYVTLVLMVRKGDGGGRVCRDLQAPCVGDKWCCDEQMQKVRGKGSYIAVMDIATRFVPAWGVSFAKGKYDAALLRKARDAASFVSRVIRILQRHQPMLR